MDAWILLYNRESNGEHNRQLYLLKSRGMAHSNQVREFIMSSDGIRLRTAYVGPEGVVTGSARLTQEAKDKAAVLVREQEMLDARARCGERWGRRRRSVFHGQLSLQDFDLRPDLAALALKFAKTGGPRMLTRASSDAATLKSHEMTTNAAKYGALSRPPAA
jgi:hypothetical protein